MGPEVHIDSEEQKLKEIFEARFHELPAPVQRAIQSADLEKRLRELANTQKLHLDQWVLLENEVKLTLYGFEPTEKLQANIESEVGVPHDVAVALAKGISDLVFEPIRQELERELSHPEAQAAEVSPTEAARQEILQANAAAGAGAQVPSVQPATPPAPAPEKKAERAALDASYSTQAASHERKSIAGDPYREQVA